MLDPHPLNELGKHLLDPATERRLIETGIVFARFPKAAPGAGGKEKTMATLTEQQWKTLDDIGRDTGNQVLMVSATEFRIIDANRRNLSGPYASHYEAALDLISGAYDQTAAHIDSGVQHGAKNKAQWAKAQKQGHAAIMRGGSV